MPVGGDDPNASFLIGFWDFATGKETKDTGLADGVAQDGETFDDAFVSDGSLFLDGRKDFFSISGDDTAFDIDEASIAVTFVQGRQTEKDGNVLVNRGEANDRNKDGYLAISARGDGSVEVEHFSQGASNSIVTRPDLFDEGDRVEAVYAFSKDTGGSLVVKNLDTGESDRIDFDVTGLSLRTDDDDGENFTIGARETNDNPNAYTKNFNGEIVSVAVYSRNILASPSRDGIVSGTDGDDLIDVDYTGDPDGDRIDAGDAILPGAKPNDDFVLAGDGDDTVLAGLGDDEVFGGTGRDSIFGETGDDTLFGEQGDDTLDGGVGRDVLDGGSEDDVLLGAQGRDTLLGGSGDDTLDGGTGRDSLEGGAGNDDLIGGQGRDTLRGGDDDDTLRGDQGNDELFGDNGDDSIDGGSGNDTADGGAGNDTLDGIGGGDDVLSGGDDRDLFVNVGAGDRVDGNDGGDDCDTLDLRGSAGDGRGEITFTSDDKEDGFVTYFDADDNEVGRLEFEEIEKIIPICFTPGTLIATPDGERPIEDLRAGDKVITRDNGIQEICWAGSRGLTGNELSASPHLKPVYIAQGSFGNGLPERDMYLSPNHRVLVANDQTALYFEEREVLVAAKHLTALEGVVIANPRWATYIHIMFEQHEVILSNGSWTESFQPGDYSLNGIGNAQRLEIQSLFPELETPAGRASYQAARKSLKRYEAQLLTRA